MYTAFLCDSSNATEHIIKEVTLATFLCVYFFFAYERDFIRYLRYFATFAYKWRYYGKNTVAKK